MAIATAIGHVGPSTTAMPKAIEPTQSSEMIHF